MALSLAAILALLAAGGAVADTATSWGQQVQGQHFSAEEAAKARDFAHAESLLGRDWSSAEAVKNRDFNAEEALKNREFNAEQAQIARDWNEKMSSTAYQRSVSDMKAAGFNPALLMGGASPASTATGIGASGSPAIAGVAPGTPGSAAPSASAPSVAGGGSFARIFDKALTATLAKENDSFGNELAKATIEEKRANTALKRQVLDSERSKAFGSIDYKPGKGFDSMNEYRNLVNDEREKKKLIAEFKRLLGD